MKTIKQIAGELGVSKQRVYRYVKKHRISEAHRSASSDAGEAHQNNDTAYYDEAVEMGIIEHFNKFGHVSEAHRSASGDAGEAHQSASGDAGDAGDAVIHTVIDLLKRELEIKNKQIEDLTKALENTTASLMAAHALHAGTMQDKLMDKEKEKGAGFFSRFRKRKESEII
jgi:hypothetical protein